jgi:NADH-quinone oxidoreductase subunit A
MEMVAVPLRNTAADAPCVIHQNVHGETCGRTRDQQAVICRGALFSAPRQTTQPANDTKLAMDLSAYLPVILFILVGVGIGVAPQALGFLLGPKRPDAQKNSPYECGFEAFEDARMKFDVRYYLVAILFILFDLEIAFLFPWAVALKDIGHTGFWAMMIFLAILVVGFIYEWKKGALDWE